MTKFSIPASSDTGESEGWLMNQCWIIYLKIHTKIPFKNLRKFFNCFHTKHISEPLSPLLHWCILFIKPLLRTVSSMMYCVCNIVQVLCHERRKIRITEVNAKCRHLKELTCKGTLRQVFFFLRPRSPYPPPLQTVYGDTDAGVLVRKLSQLTSSDKRANPRYFIMLCRTSSELAGCVNQPIMDSESTISGWGQTKT
jgi:hypothetical protein